MLYRINHDQVCTENIKTKLHPATARDRRRRGQQYNVPHCRTLYLKYSFLPRTIRDWNDLSQDTVEAKTIDTFLSRASKELLPSLFSA